MVLPVHAPATDLPSAFTGCSWRFQLASSRGAVLGSALNLCLFVQIMAKNKKQDATSTKENSRKRKKQDTSPAAEPTADKDGQLPDIVAPAQVRTNSRYRHALDNV